MKSKDFESYFEQLKVNKKLPGASDKRFGLIKDNKDSFEKKLSSHKAVREEKSPKDSLFFGELFKELKKANCSYKTYFNELITGATPELRGKEIVQNVYLPGHIMCLIKTQEGNNFYGECVGSKLANLLEVDTVYSTAYKQVDEDFDPSKRSAYYPYILSVDFVPKNHKMTTFLDLGIEFTSDDEFELWLEKIDDLFEKNTRGLKFKTTPGRMTKLKDDLCKMYLYRNLLCQDDDCSCQNIALLYDKRGNFRLAPCFDMEYMFYPYTDSAYAKYLITNMRFIRENYPHVLDEFMSGVVKNFKNGKIHDIMTNTLQLQPEVYATALRCVERSAEAMEQCWRCDIKKLYYIDGKEDEEYNNCR